MSWQSTPPGSPTTARPPHHLADPVAEEDDDFYAAPPPHSPSYSEASSSHYYPPGPPPFSLLDFVPGIEPDRAKPADIESSSAPIPPSFVSPSPEEEPLEPDPSPLPLVAETKSAFTPEQKPESQGKSTEDGEPPPPYTEGSSPIESFTYVMAAAGGASSIITQVQQAGGPPINTLGGMNWLPDGCAVCVLANLRVLCYQISVGMNISRWISGEYSLGSPLNYMGCADCIRGTRFTLSRDELLTLPEFVLLSLFPNGLLPDGHMGTFHEGDIYPVDVRNTMTPTSYAYYSPDVPPSSTTRRRSNTCWISSARSPSLSPPRHLRQRRPTWICPIPCKDPLETCSRIGPVSSCYGRTSISMRFRRVRISTTRK